MFSLDMQNKKKSELTSAIAAAMRGNDENALAQAFADFGEFVQGQIVQEANELGAAVAQDSTILASRGYRQLTSAETKYYDALNTAFKSDNPKMALNNIEVSMPETVVEAVITDIQEQHPLLNALKIVNTKGAIRMIVNAGGVALASWGKLTDSQKTEIEGSIQEVDTTLLKLIAFLPVPKSMIDLGAVWLDRYVRALLAESAALGMENGYVTGDGDGCPIGMTRIVGKDAETAGGKYKEKTAIAVTNFSKKTYGELLGKIAVNSETGKTRDVGEVVLICNPVDYFTKIMPATCMLTSSGTYVKDLFPFPTNVIRCSAVPAGKAIFGIADRYFAAFGINKQGKIDYDDSVQFLEDNRVYMIKFYGNAFPLDNNAFLLLDIEGLKEMRFPVSTLAESLDSTTEDEPVTP